MAVIAREKSSGKMSYHKFRVSCEEFETIETRKIGVSFPSAKASKASSSGSSAFPRSKDFFL